MSLWTSRWLWTENRIFTPIFYIGKYHTPTTLQRIGSISFYFGNIVSDFSYNADFTEGLTAGFGQKCTARIPQFLCLNLTLNFLVVLR